ncbi:solute carrier family 35 member F4-like isoform X2 [Ptychodera flava]
MGTTSTSNMKNDDFHPTVEDERDRRCTCISETTRKWLLGLFIVIGIAVSWVGSTQFSQSTYSPNFNGPFFNVWFGTSWMLVCYPGYLIPTLILTKNTWRNLFRENEEIFGKKGLTWWSGFRLVFPFCFCWMATNYMYVYALGVIAAADVTALFSSNTAFIYILSWIWLSETFTPLKLLATLCSIVGVIVMAYSDGFSGSTAVGVILSIGAAIGSALYKVLFKRYVRNANLGQVSLFLSLLAMMNIFCFWPVMLTLYYTGVEYWDWNDMPWDYLCGSSALSVVFNFLVNFGIAFTYPLFIAIGTVLGIPLNAVVDYIWRDSFYDYIKIIGTVLIIAGFLLMLIPPSWQDKVMWPKFMRCKKCYPDVNQGDGNQGDGSKESVDVEDSTLAQHS